MLPCPFSRCQGASGVRTSQFWVFVAVALLSHAATSAVAGGNAASSLCTFVFDSSEELTSTKPALSTGGRARNTGAHWRWIAGADSTWTNDLTFFVSFTDAAQAQRAVLHRAPSASNRSHHRSHQSLVFNIRKLAEAEPEEEGKTSRWPSTWKKGLRFWASLSEVLKAENSSEASSFAASLDRCQWLLHVDITSYVNIDRLAARLDCLERQLPEYYAFAPMVNDASVVLADELGGYLLSRRLLLQLNAASWIRQCASRVEYHREAIDFATDKRPGFYVSFCLWMMFRLRPQRLGDPAQEVLVPMSQGENSAVSRLRGLLPMGHCILVVVCESPQALLAVHRIVADKVNNAQVGCWVDSIREPWSLAPPWGARTARALMFCPLRLAIRREAAAGANPLSLGRLIEEMKLPSRPVGEAANRLRSGARLGRRWELCILLPATGASEKQVLRARATAATWARKYLQVGSATASRQSMDASDNMHGRGKGIIALMYSQRPLFPSWRHWTLSLPGDLDLRHPKFNALRFLYLWHVLAEHHAEDCDFFMKADMDAYVDVLALRQALREFNESAPIYTGKVTFSHGPGYEKWTSFAHGLGYILSRGALKHARIALRDCLHVLMTHRTEAIEDMTLAACLRRARMSPHDLGPVKFNFVDGGAIEDDDPLITHPVNPEDMFRIHDAWMRKRNGLL